MSAFWQRLVLNLGIITFTVFALGACDKSPTGPSGTCTDKNATNFGSPGECHYAPNGPVTPPPATTYTLSGRVTDGTSGGILPNIDVQILDGGNAGKAAKTDGSGNYSIPNVNAGGMNVKFSAVSYVDQVVGVNVSANTTRDVVLQRTAPVVPPPPPPSISLSGVVTDGTSGGVLPGVSVRITGSGTSNFGKNVTTDSSGRYTLSGLVAESRVNAEATASGYQVGSGSAAVPGTLNFVLQRAATTGTLRLTLDAATCTRSTLYVSIYIDGVFKIEMSGPAGIPGSSVIINNISIGPHTLSTLGNDSFGPPYSLGITMTASGLNMTLSCRR